MADFNHGVDLLVFSGADYGLATGQVLDAARFTVGASAVGAGGHAAVAIARLDASAA